MEITEKEALLLQELHEKFKVQNQSFETFLEGLVHTKPITYWDYLQLDIFHSLQKPKTNIPDEMVFIIYHQITELYFRLIQLEVSQLLAEAPTEERLMMRLTRITAYFKHLTTSFEVMVIGMELEQFLQFRTALVPASGFQAVNFRKLELQFTSLQNLLDINTRSKFLHATDIVEMYAHIYWKSGNLEDSSGQKTLTLQMFEEKYDEELIQFAKSAQNNNLESYYQTLPDILKNNASIIEELKNIDIYANVFWRLSHYKVAAKYFSKEDRYARGTGGTNWRKYLQPKTQKIIFFPQLWNEQQIQEWGEKYMLEIFNHEVEQFWNNPNINNTPSE